MIIFTDFHHSGLLQSFIITFEKRLGHKVYRPIGLEWFEKGFWRINHQRDTAEQFLGLHVVPKDGTPGLNDVTGYQEGVYKVRDIIDGENKAITFDAFMRTPVDVVIASIPAHLEPFRILCDMHPNKPKLVFQIGNNWELVDTNLVKNFMVSTKVSAPPIIDVNYIQYHQEFSLDDFNAGGIFTLPDKNIYSFINILQSHRDWPLFLELEQDLPDWQFRSYGGQCRDGNMTGSKALGEKMREARFIWHTKQGGDGYGHILYNSAAVGRPVIIRRADYEGKLGDELLIDGQTSIFIDGLSKEQIIEKILYYSEPVRYRKMSRHTWLNFNDKVNFAAEAQMIEDFLHNLK